MIRPKVSVLVAVYNSAPYIAETIKSVLNQTYTDFELVLLNDASTDESEKIIAEFKDPRIRYYKNESNLGISATRNKLMDLADKNTQYYAVLDNDDLCAPTRLAKQVEFMDKNPDVSIAGSYFELFCSNKNINALKRFIINLGFVWCHPLRPSLKDALKGNVVMHPTCILRAKDLKENAIKYRQEYSPAEDYDLVRQILNKNLKLANIPIILTRYNLHGDNCSILQKNKINEMTEMIQQELAIFYGLPVTKRYPRWKVVMKKLRLKWFI